MIKQDTVFILGAGASAHYGYPVGEELVGHIIRVADRFGLYCHTQSTADTVSLAPPTYVQSRIQGAFYHGPNIAQAWKTVSEECSRLAARLKTIQPLLIDHFLSWNESLRAIGKLMIAASILECESRWNSKNAFPPKEDHWYRFLVHRLVYECQEGADLLSNRIKFITFNYDTSLETQLDKSLRSIDLFDKETVDTFLENRIEHVYGYVPAEVPVRLDRGSEAMRGFMPTQLSNNNYISEINTVVDQWHKASENLRTVDPHDKELNASALNSACEWVAKAKFIYILGYGFDANNSRRIGLDRILGGASVKFTNYQDRDVVNKSAGKTFRLGDKLTEAKTAYRKTDLATFRCAKSDRSVYQALAWDFEAEECF